MKKIYSAPALELTAYLSDVAISNDWESEYGIDAPGISSEPWNNGELGWT